VASTVVVCVLWWLGVFNRLEMLSQDLHFRHLSTMQADAQIVLIDINDFSLEHVHRWPWPRRTHADLVRTLDELGARTIVMDIAFPDHSVPRVEHANLGKHWDVDRDAAVLGDPDDDPTIFDDRELAAAVALAGNVYVAGLVDLAPPGVDPVRAIEQAMELVRDRPEMNLSDFDQEVSLPESWSITDTYRMVRIAVLLEKNFSLDQEDLTKLADVEADIEQLAEARRLVARQAAERFLSEHPDGDWPAFHALVLPDEPMDHLTPAREELLLALRSWRSVYLTRDRCPPVPPSLKGKIPYGYDLRPPIERIAAVAKGVGFVTHQREDHGGVVRDTPLVADANGHLLYSLGFLVACDVAGVDRSSPKLSDRFMEFVLGDGVWRAELSDRGTTLINWHTPGGNRRWQDSLTHVPVTRILEIALNRRAIEQNGKRSGLKFAGLVELRHHQTGSAYADYRTLVKNLNTCKTDLQMVSTDKEARSLQVQIDELTEQIESAHAEAIDWLRYQWRIWGPADPANEDEQNRRDQIERLYGEFVGGKALANLRDCNEKLKRRNERLHRDLRNLIEGKICFVGYTATAVADLVSTPIYNTMPGVMAHANIANMALGNRFASAAPGWTVLLGILVCGLVMTVLTCMRGPLMGVVSLVVVSGLILLAAGVAFRTAECHFPSLVACLGTCVVWVFVTLHRQFTEERAKRHMRRALAQYTSPAVAAQIARRTTAEHLTARPARVTCFFSDLKDFTQLSERLGARQTRDILNRYLQGVSAVLVEHGAIVNKFIGDGIFAFYNAPIRPCPDQAQAACAGAIASMDILQEINRAASSGGGGETLAMRMGLSTGEAFVGDYGSDTKLDYTCIGDIVNVGSRLEGANKVFGTSILVNDATRCGAGDGFLFRNVGLLRIAGKTTPIKAHELLGPIEKTDGTTREFVERFEQVLHSFQSRQWDLCRYHLAACERLRSNDPVAKQYLHELSRFSEMSLPDDWDGAIVLAGK